MPRVFLIRRHLADVTEFDDDDDFSASILTGKFLTGKNSLIFYYSVLFVLFFFHTSVS